MIQAVFDQIIVKVVYQDKVNEDSLLIIPETAVKQEGAFYGIVMSIGADFPYKEDVAIGDKVMFNRHEGHLVESGMKDELYMLIPDRLLAIIKE